MTATAPNEPVARIRGLGVTVHGRRGDVRAVDGVDLDIARGEILALVGESGSGKSVLSSTLLGLLPEGVPSHVEGEVEVAGVDMLAGRASDRRRVRRLELGAVFQDPMGSLDPTMRIGDQLGERGADAVRRVAVLEDAGVPAPESRLRQWPHELSGGLRQRVMIAMALAASNDGGGDGTPSLIVADEPTTALDVSVQARIIRLFARLRDEHGCAIVLVTHDLAVAAEIADRIAVMQRGVLVEQGTPDEVLRHPRHDYTRALVAARVRLSTPRAPVAAATGTPALELDRISKTYPRASAPAVDDVTLTVPAGGAVALVGESGSGKTTLLRIACGLLAPDAGSVRSEGTAPPQLIHQDAGGSLTPWLSVGAQLEDRLRALGVPRRERRERAVEFAERVGLEPALLRSRPRELSGGQRQRAAIARALATDPRVLVCDEPVSALDASLAVRVLDLIDELRERFGVSVLMVTHDLAAARYLCDTGAVMRQGRIVDVGDFERLVRDPAHPYAEELWAATPHLDLADGTR